MGTETEYGISVKNAREQDPVAASTLVVNAYKTSRGDVPSATSSVTWDYEQESPFDGRSRVSRRGGHTYQRGRHK